MQRKRASILAVTTLIINFTDKFFQKPLAILTSKPLMDLCYVSETKHSYKDFFFFTFKKGAVCKKSGFF